MFREMRRDDKSLKDREVIDILRDNNYGILSTIGENDYAYGVPINYVYDENSIYFHCAGEGYKLDNISKNNKASFCVVGKSEAVSEKFTTKYNSVIVFGKINKIEYDRDKKEILMKFIEKFAPEHLDRGRKYVENSFGGTTLLKLDIEHLTGKGSK